MKLFRNRTTDPALVGSNIKFVTKEDDLLEDMKSDIITLSYCFINSNSSYNSVGYLVDLLTLLFSYYKLKWKSKISFNYIHHRMSVKHYNEGSFLPAIKRIRHEK